MLAALLVFGVAACGDDDEPSGDATPSDTPTSEVTTSETPSETPSESTSETPSESPSQTSTPKPPPSQPPTTALPPEPTAPSQPPTSTAPTNPGPTTYAEALARFDARGTEPATMKRFRTPAGTYCLLQSDFAIGCELDSGKGVPAADYCGPDGPVDSVGRITYGEAGNPVAECNSDTIREPGAKLVGDGSAIAAPGGGGLLCLVEDIGVTCVDKSNQTGFYLGTGYSVF